MNRRLLTLLLALAFSSIGAASALHVGTPIQISQPTVGPLRTLISDAKAATDGSSYLVVTAGRNSTAAATLLDARGTILSSQDLGLTGLTAVVYVGWDGDQYVVFTSSAWEPARFDRRTILYATRLAATGEIIDTRTLSRDLVGTPSIAFDGTNYAVAHGWVNVAYWNRDLEYRGIDVQIALPTPVNGTLNLIGPAIGSAGDGFVLLFGGTAPDSTQEIRAARLDDDGRVLSSSVLARGPFDGGVKIGSNGTSYLAIFGDLRSAPEAVLLDLNATPIGSPVGIEGSYGPTGDVEGFGNDYLIAVLDGLRILRASSSQPLSFETIASGVPFGTTDIVSGADRALVLGVGWSSTTGPDGNLVGNFYDLTGTEIGHLSYPVRPLTKVGASDPVIGWGDKAYLAAWGETRWRDGEPVSGIGARMLTPQGYPFGPTVWFPGTRPMRVAYGNGMFAVLTWADNTIVARRISDDGRLLDTESKVLLTGRLDPTTQRTEFAWDGEAFRMVYTPDEGCQHSGDIRSIRLTPEGDVEAATTLRDVENWSELSSFACAAGQCMLSWVEVQDVCGTEWHPTGSVHRIEAGTVLESRPIVISEGLHVPRLAATGDAYLALWNAPGELTGQNYYTVQVYAGLVDREGRVVQGGDGMYLLLQMENATANAVWDGMNFLVFSQLWGESWNHYAQPTTLVRVDKSLHLVDPEPTLAPHLKSIDSSRDGRSVGLTLPFDGNTPSIVYAVPIIEASRGRALSR